MLLRAIHTDEGRECSVLWTRKIEARQALLAAILVFPLCGECRGSEAECVGLSAGESQASYRRLFAFGAARHDRLDRPTAERRSLAYRSTEDRRRHAHYYHSVQLLLRRQRDAAAWLFSIEQSSSPVAV